MTQTGWLSYKHTSLPSPEVFFVNILGFFILKTLLNTIFACHMKRPPHIHCLKSAPEKEIYAQNN